MKIIIFIINKIKLIIINNMKDDEKKIIDHNRCFTPKLKKANKIRMELLSLTKDQMEKKETKFNRFSI